MGGASSFLGTTTFFSGTFFLISGTLKIPFNDKNVFLKSKKESKKTTHTEDHHTTFNQKKDGTQAAVHQEMSGICRGKDR